MSGIKTYLHNSLANGELIAARLIDGFPSIKKKAVILGTADYVSAHTFFAGATRTTAGTTAVVTPVSGGSIWVTDLLISGEKQAGSTVEVRFTDGTNTATLFLASQVDAPPQIAHTIRGRVQGWKNARIDMITSGAGDATVAVVYAKFNEGIEFAAWNALR